jgi:hypothetical protein
MAARASGDYAEGMLLELAVVALSLVGFVVLDWYVVGCEKV